MNNKTFEIKQGGFRKTDIDRIRKSIQVGDRIEDTILLDCVGDRLVFPKKVRVKVLAKYPHLIQVSRPDGRELPIKTITYVELLQRETGKK